MIGDSAPMQQLKKEIAVVAPTDLNVLITGETGVGKELVAQALHRQSARAASPLIYLNCAALPETVAESELFGHVKGPLPARCTIAQANSKWPITARCFSTKSASCR